MNRSFRFLKTGVLALAGALLTVPSLAADPVSTSSPEARLADRVRHEIVMLPYLSVFDNIGIAVNGDQVTLTGAVTRPTLRSSAERVAAKVEGVEKVDNQIEVLPLSNFDNQIRLGVLRAIYGAPALQRYAMIPVSPIRIIVKNGDVTLLGIVNNELEKNVAGIQANQVFGVFSVKNELQVERPKTL